MCAEPEILEWNLTPSDKFAVIASDGVFEFITSQNVVEMIAKIKDPIEAAKFVVAEAYRLWLTFDDRTDDISIIIIYFDDFKPNAGVKETASAKLARVASMKNASVDGDGNFRDSRPVRKVMSLAKRKDISENFENADTSAPAFDFDAVVDTKTPEEFNRVMKMLNNNFMFQNLSITHKENICKVMKLRNVTVNQLVIREGDRGDEMYIVNRYNYYRYFH